MGNYTSCTSSTKSDVELKKQDSRPSLMVEQKMAIKDTWWLLTNDEWAHGGRIFLALFKEHPEYRHNFPFMDANGVLKLSELAIMEGLERHSSQFMDILDMLVGHAVTPVPKGWRKQVTAMTQLFKEVESTGQVFKDLTEVFVNYLQSAFPEKVHDYERESWEAFFEELISQISPKLPVEAKEKPRSKSDAAKIEWPPHYNIDENDSIFEASSKGALSDVWSLKSLTFTPMSERATILLKSIVDKRDRKYLDDESQAGSEKRHSNGLRSYDIDKLNIPMPKGFARNNRNSMTSSFQQSSPASSGIPSLSSNRKDSMQQPPNIYSRRDTNRESISSRPPIGAPHSGAKPVAKGSLDLRPSPRSLYKSQESLPPRYRYQKSLETISVFPKNTSEYTNPITERTSEYNALFPKETVEVRPTSPRRTVVPKNFFPEKLTGKKSPSLQKKADPMTPFQTKTEKPSTPSTALEKPKPLADIKSSSVKFHADPVKHHYDADEETAEEEYDESPRVRRRRRMRLAETLLQRENPGLFDAYRNAPVGTNFHKNP